MIGRVNAGGGGSLQSTDAILRVIAPAGSTVTISKGTVSKSDQGHENASDNTLYDYYFIIHASQFDGVNPWTVTATLGADTASTTIIINSANEYDVTLEYILKLFWDGSEETSHTGGWEIRYESSKKSSLQSSYINMSSAASNLQNAGTINAVDLTGYATLKVQYYNSTSSIGSNASTSSFLGLYNSKPSGTTTYSQGSATSKLAFSNQSADYIFSLDVSNINASKYIVLYSANAYNYTIKRIWLEK